MFLETKRKIITYIILVRPVLPENLPHHFEAAIIILFPLPNVPVTLPQSLAVVTIFFHEKTVA